MTGQPKTKKPRLGKLKSLEVREPRTNFFSDGGGDSGEDKDGGGDGAGDEERKDNITAKWQFIFGVIGTIVLVFGFIYEIKKYQFCLMESMQMQRKLLG